MRTKKLHRIIPYSLVFHFYFTWDFVFRLRNWNEMWHANVKRRWKVDKKNDKANSEYGMKRRRKKRIEMVQRFRTEIAGDRNKALATHFYLQKKILYSRNFFLLLFSWKFLMCDLFSRIFLNKTFVAVAAFNTVSFPSSYA